MDVLIQNKDIMMLYKEVKTPNKDVLLLYKNTTVYIIHNKDAI